MQIVNLTDEELKSIYDLAKSSNAPVTELETILKKENKVRKSISYNTIRLRVNEVRSPKSKKLAVATTNLIESVTSLCASMTNWTIDLARDFVKRKKEIRKLEKDILKLAAQPEEKLMGPDYRLFIIKQKFLTNKQFALKDTKRELNESYENFVNLLKTPALKQTNVNILQQRLEASLQSVIDDRPTDEISIPILKKNAG